MGRLTKQTAARALILGLLVAGCGSPTATPGAVASPTAAATSTPARTTPSATAAELAAITARGMLIVAVKREESPRGVNLDVAHFQKRNFEVGIAGAIAQRLLGDAGKVELLVVSKPERIPSVATGRADLVISMFPITPENQRILDFSRPYATGGVTFVTRAGSGLRGIAQLAGRRVAIAMQERDEIETELAKLASAASVSLTTQPYPSFVDGAAAVESGAADALVSNSINIAVHMSAKPGVFETPPALLWPETYGVGVRKGSPALLAAVDAVLAEMKSSGALATLATKTGFPTPAR